MTHFGFKITIGSLIFAFSSVSYAVPQGISGCINDQTAWESCTEAGGTNTQCASLKKFWSCIYGHKSGFLTKKRKFHAYLPPAFFQNSKQKRPLVIALHGHGDLSKWIMTYAKLSEASKKYGFILVAPDGLRKPWYKPAQHWNDGRDEFPNYRKNGKDKVDDVGFIQSLVADVKKVLNPAVNTDKIYIIGISNGGLMSQRMLCETDIFAGAGIVSATMHKKQRDEQCNNAKPTPIVFLHGSKDEVMPQKNGDTIGSSGGPGYAIADTVKFWLEKNSVSKGSCQLGGKTTVGINTKENVELQIATTGCQQNSHGTTAKVAYYEVLNGEHEWFSNKTKLPASDNKEDEVDATTEIMTFFGFSE